MNCCLVCLGCLVKMLKKKYGLACIAWMQSVSSCMIGSADGYLGGIDHARQLWFLAGLMLCWIAGWRLGAGWRGHVRTLCSHSRSKSYSLMQAIQDHRCCLGWFVWHPNQSQSTPVQAIQVLRISREAWSYQTTNSSFSVSPWRCPFGPDSR